MGDGLINLESGDKHRLLCSNHLEDLYHIEATPFARGRFAAVKRAFNRSDKSVFAAKFIRKRRVTPHEVWHEVAVLALSSECPFIVQLFQVFETPLDTVLLLEMGRGGDLQTHLDKEEFLQESSCVPLMKDILEGLSFLHSHSIAHLDIKPQNLVLTAPIPEGRVKLCDFGVSRKLSKASEVRGLIGTIEYLSPEVLSYEPITLATDLWAIGVLTYVLLSGRSPFAGDNKQETFLNISQRALTFPDEHFQEVSSKAIDFISSLLNINPNERPTVSEALNHVWVKECGNVKPEKCSTSNHINNIEYSKHMPNINVDFSITNDQSKLNDLCQYDTKTLKDEPDPVGHNLNGNESRSTNDDIDSGIGSEDDHRRNLSWARLDEVLENEQRLCSNTDWLTLETDENLGKRIWPNRKKMKSWEAECTGAVLRALDMLERKRESVTPQADLLRAYGRRSQVIAKEILGQGQVVIREFRPLSKSPSYLTKHSELTCDSISTRINKLFQ